LGRLRHYINRLRKRAERDHVAIPQKGGGVFYSKGPEEWLQAFGWEMSRLKETYRTGKTTKDPHQLTEAVRNTTSERARREHDTLLFMAAYAEGEEAPEEEDTT
jgi:hypothetical protein